jgi:type II secretory pathway pseudopilin PulG
VTICPCCGFKFVGALSNGCRQCGARAVGEPLPKPAHELPSYGRALVLAVGGSLTVLVFLTQLIVAMFQKKSGSFGFWTWVAAGETAAWRLKWIAIPLFIVTAWLGRKLYRSIKFQPERFCGVKYARRGLVSSCVVVILIAFLIVITVPARLENRRIAREEGIKANWHTFERALLEYRSLYKTYPADFKDLRERISDPDGSLAAVLATLDPNGYHPSADVAAVASEKSRRLRGAVIRNASVSSAGDDMPTGGLAFTTYELRLPGEDKIFGNEDDWIASNGILRPYSEVAKGGVGRSVSAGILQP